MKISNVVWYVFGGVVLVGLGFALGFFVPFRGAAELRPMMAGGFRGGFPFMMMGVRSLFGLIQCIGPLAGIAALIIVLTRRPVAATMPAPAPIPETSAAPTQASNKTSPKSK